MIGVPHRCLFTAYRLLDLTPAHAGIRLWPEYPPTPDSRTRHYEFTDWGPMRSFDDARQTGQAMTLARIALDL